jgi:2-dehydro-3-deoxyphosphooctonate aldolase (KDO 8-P synthase)
MENTLFTKMKNKFFIMSGPNVIESEDHVMLIASKMKKIMEKYDVEYIFKTSFDKANRSSSNSYRGLGIEEGL